MDRPTSPGPQHKSRTRRRASTGRGSGHQLEIATLRGALLRLPQLQQLVEMFIAELLLDLTLRECHRNAFSCLLSLPRSIRASSPHVLYLFPEEENTQTNRKLIVKVTPSYPELAKRIKLSGSVKMLVTVAPNGTIKKAEVLGGSPVLAQAAENAVQKWKWLAGPCETKEPVGINFHSD
jgi:TonB family protein